MTDTATMSSIHGDRDAIQRCLAAPFPDADVEWRIQQAGEKHGRVWARVLPYLTARAVMQRLDEVFGLDGWQVTYAPGPVGGTMATLSVRVRHEDGSIGWITKSDGADVTDVEGVKGAYSGALKRAAVLLGIGRYLYGAGEFWAVVHDGGRLTGRTKEGRAFRWDPPAAPRADMRAEQRTLEEIEEALGQLRIVDDRVAGRLRGRVEVLRRQIEASESYAREILEKIRVTVGATPISSDPVVPRIAAGLRLRGGAAA